jgi:hypothetical protein
VRTRAPAFDDSLEALPVGAFAPRDDTFPQARVTRVLTPWLESSRPELTPSREPLGAGTFRRMVPIDATRLAALPDWWLAFEYDGYVRVTSSCMIGPFARVGPTTWNASCVLGHTRMDLSIWRHLCDWTLLYFRPSYKPRAGVHYFRTGHHALDVLIERLSRELPLESV